MPNKGDLVVHLTHGIGTLGLKQLKTFVGVSDCLEILYKDESKVFVPIEHMNLISKYFGPLTEILTHLIQKMEKEKIKLSANFDMQQNYLKSRPKDMLQLYSFDLYENEY